MPRIAHDLTFTGPEIATEMTAIVEARNAERGVLLAKAGQPVVNNADLLGRIRKFFGQRS